MRKPRVLVAGTPKAIGIVAAALGEEVDIVTASTIAEALQRCRADVALIVTHVTFDESRMLDFLQALPKHRPPVVCLRLFGPLSKSTRRATREALAALGVKAFIDLYEMRERLGEEASVRELERRLREEYARLA